MAVYDHKKIEAKWKKVWADKKIYQPSLSEAKRPFYNLMMFPYPSAEGLHVGNMYAFTGADVYGRFKRMSGYDVFEPIGLDGFGIHSENYAIKVGQHPAEQAKISQAHFYDQLSKIGNGFAWDQRLETYDPEYYKWTQWLFVKMFKKGLAYRGKALVNWCPSCKTVLADEQVEAGVCERCKTEVVKKEMEQWFFKITAYADRLLANLDKIDWPNKIKVAQRNWIGRSEGHVVSWQRADGKGQVETFTTRIDTLLGVTFLVVGEGQESRYKVVHPVTGEEVEVWAGDYVVTDYGTGAVMGVPASDERDRAFAKEHGLEVRQFKPFKPRRGGEEFIKAETRYHLRDWLISRQRYWGPPIPMIWCDTCNWQAVPEEDLPVVLPGVRDWKPSGDGKSPLEKASRLWLEVNCPKCGQKARRETDVSDTFLDSSWYFLRYPSTTLGAMVPRQLPFDPEITKKWLPVDAYIGGAEHAVLHLLYSRFVTMALKDWGYVDFEEPFPFLFSHGLIIKDGAKMSKSRGNVVNPDEYIDRYGADALRMYLMFVGPYSQGGDFRDTGMVGMYRFLERIWKLFQEQFSIFNYQLSKNTDPELRRKLHQTIKKVTEDLSNFKYNTAIAAIMELVNVWKGESMAKDDMKLVVKLLAPLAPFVAEELWENLREKGSVHLASWPEYDPEWVKTEETTIVVQVNGRVRSTLDVRSQMADDREEVIKIAKTNERVKKYLEGKKVKNIVWVPQKLVNFVIH